MSALKVHIENLFEEWDIEVKEEQAELSLIVIRSKCEFRHKDPKVWSAQVSNSTFLPEIRQLIQQASENPHRPKMITISDGTYFTINYAADDTKYQVTVSDFEEDTNEYNLVEKLLDSCVKWTDEDPLIGSLSERWKKNELNK